MKKTKLVLLLAAACLVALPGTAAPLGTTFTYQGRLVDGGNLASGNYGMVFYLYDAPTNGNQLGQLGVVSVPVNNGLFTQQLDFGAAFDGNARWLEIAVQTNGAAGFTTLTPRQALTPAPNALFAAGAALASTATTAGAVGPNAVTATGIQDATITAAKISGGQVVKSLNGLKDDVTLAAGANVTITPSGNTLTIAAPGGVVGGPWSLNGANAYYNGGNVGIGTISPANKLTVLTPTLGYGVEHTDGDIRLSTFVGRATGFLGTLSNHKLTFFANDNGFPNMTMTLDTGGRVGIGTDSPANKLTVLASGYGLEHTDGTIRLGTYVTSGAGWLGTINNFPLSFFVNNGQASMTVSTNGNIGIGTTTPQERLTIANTFGRSQGLRISGVGADGVGMALDSVGPGGRKWSLVSGDIFNPLVPSIAGNFRVVDEAASATRLVIAPDGNVGIGNIATPQAKLDVQGNARIDGSLTATSSTNGVSGTATGNGTGVYGVGGTYGVYGRSEAYGVYGKGAFGVFGETTGPAGGAAIQGVAVAGTFAGSFQGEVVIAGGLQVTGSKNFKIDHPLDPANKYLIHSCIESPERMNIYNGNVTTGDDAEAVVELPGYFSALNCDFRYQFTVLGQFAQAIIAKEIENNRFTIKTDKPNVKVSWQVMGVRQDAYARAHPIVVEQEKSAADKGSYLMPELFGQPPEKQIGHIAPPKMPEMETLNKHSVLDQSKIEMASTTSNKSTPFGN